jgi:peptidyl-prolyl cis-trans isomerase C
VTVVERAKRLAREPLVHFLVVGALIFAVWGGGGDAADRSITVTEAQVRGLTEQWEQQWHRQPAPAQVDGLIRDLIKDEVYYREAVRLGLDKDDIIMRRRMRSKMEFLIAAQAENEVPSDAALQNWLDTHRRDYATNAALSFDHIYVGNDVDRARRALAQLDKGADPAALTSPLSVPPTLDNAPAEDIDRQFGDGFAKAVAALPPGRWAASTSFACASSRPARCRRSPACERQSRTTGARRTARGARTAPIRRCSTATPSGSPSPDARVAVECDDRIRRAGRTCEGGRTAPRLS